MRLAKFLAGAGVASRRAAEEIIRAGRVSVGGTTSRDPARDVAEGDLVELDGRPVELERERFVYALNKPSGVLSSARDTHGRPTVVELVPSRARLYPVGRLDADTTGLILLTNDGALAHRLTHPRFEVPKRYRARVAGGPVRAYALARLRSGVELEDGLTSPAEVESPVPGTLELTLREGRKRQVRRMCEAVGHPVIALERLAIGPLELGSLAPGSHRLLAPEEVAALSEAGRGGGPCATGSSSASAPRSRG